MISAHGGRTSESKDSAGPIERIENRIFLVRGQKVLLDADLAALYGVSTKRFNEQVRRNAARFPEDFMFRLAAEEWNSLRSQFATLKAGRGQHRKYLPVAFTEHGASISSRRRLGSHDQAIAGLVNTIRSLLSPPEPARKRRIGFVQSD